MENVLYSYENGLATLTLNRPDKRNALDPSLVQGIAEALKQAQNDSAKVVLLKGNGPAFCAGADLAHLQRLAAFSPEENLEDGRQLRDTLLAIWESPCVVVASVHGPAVAGGCGLASVCDFVIASDEALFGYPETRIGFVPALVAVFAIQKFGTALAAPYLLQGRTFTAYEAKDLGLVQTVVPADELETTTHKLSQDLLSGCSAQSLAATKKLIRMSEADDLHAKLEQACLLNVATRQTADFKRGVAAVLQKEKISWLP